MEIAVSKTIQDLIDSGLFERLPPTFCTYFYDQIQEWRVLFPAERTYYERLFTLLAYSDLNSVQQLFAQLREAERLMGVTDQNWPRHKFTLQQVSLIHRSPHYTRWREAVAFAFSRIDHILDADTARKGRPRLAIVISPRDLAATAAGMWTRIANRGKRVRVELPSNQADYLPLLLTGASRDNGSPSFADMYAASEGAAAYGAWIIEAGESISALSRHPAVTRLSYARLQPYRLRLMKEVQEVIEKERIRGSTALGPRLKELKVLPAESEVADDPTLAEFLRSTLLVGNGTLLLNNTFVEWATVNAVRRARPAVTLVSFGLRSHLKPFSSLLIYADQDSASAAPAPPDLEGSYLDLEIFDQYVWQEFAKYAEYRGNLACLFVREGLDELLAIGPADFPLLAGDEPFDLAQAHGKTAEWLGVAALEK
jgi:hypothetical protein